MRKFSNNRKRFSKTLMRDDSEVGKSLTCGFKKDEKFCAKKQNQMDSMRTRINTQMEDLFSVQNEQEAQKRTWANALGYELSALIIYLIAQSAGSAAE